MVILQKFRLIFLATPKTGSTAIEMALRPHASAFVTSPPQLKHASLRRFTRRIAPLFGPELRGFETVALVREPQSWVGSWYRFRTRPQARDRDTSTFGLSFTEFVEAYLAPERPPYAQIGTQAGMLTDGSNRVDHLFRHEDIERFWEFLEARHGAPLNRPAMRNVSPAGDETLPEELRIRLHTALQDDYALWHSASHGAMV